MGNLEINLAFVKPDILFFCLFGFIIAALMSLGKLVRKREGKGERERERSSYLGAEAAAAPPISETRR